MPLKNRWKRRLPQAVAAVIATLALLCPWPCHAQISKANQILINRGLQVEGLVATYDTFTLSTYSNANYTAVIWLWDAPRSYNAMSQLGAAPGFPWARWVTNENGHAPARRRVRLPEPAREPAVGR